MRKCCVNSAELGDLADATPSVEQVEEDALQLRSEATARSLREVAQAQQALRDTVRRLHVQLRGAWLGKAHQEFETLKVRGSQV